MPNINELYTEPYYYARDHKRGPGAWCVRGLDGFEMPVPDKLLGLAIGKLLSGNIAEAKSAAEDWVRYRKIEVTRD